MRLLIKSEIRIPLAIESGEVGNIDQWLIRSGLKYSTEQSNGNFCFIIPPQGCFMDEQKMNNLFYNVFFMSNLKISYRPLPDEFTLTVN